MNRKIRALVAAVATVTFMAMGAVSAEAHDEYWVEGNQTYPIAYVYTFYSDAEKTQVTGYAEDRCVQSGNTVYASHPNISTPYYDETPIFVCSGMGPYLPSNWPY